MALGQHKQANKMRELRILGQISLLTLVFNFNSFAQAFPEKEIIGTWKVNKFENQMSGNPGWPKGDDEKSGECIS